MRWFFYIYSLTRPILLIAVVLAFVHLYLGSVFFVSGESMLPTLQNGDVLWVNKIAYLRTGPKRGDIVVLKYPGDPDKRKFVKRIVGMPNEQIDIKNGRIFVNGRLLTEAYLDTSVVTDPEISVKLKQDEYYTVGDNRPNSSDSRVFGPTPARFLVGSAKLRLFPPERSGYIAQVFY